MLLFFPLLHRGIDERCEQRLRRHEYQSFSTSVNAPYGFDTSTSSFPTTTSPKIYSGSSRRTTGPIIDPVTRVELVGDTLPSLFFRISGTTRSLGRSKPIPRRCHCSLAPFVPSNAPSTKRKRNS